MAVNEEMTHAYAYITDYNDINSFRSCDICISLVIQKAIFQARYLQSAQKYRTKAAWGSAGFYIAANVPSFSEREHKTDKAS